MSEYVYPNCRAVVAYNGSRVRLDPRQSWAADDPFVKARPDLFDNDPRQVARTAEVPEATTRAPGEVRQTPPRKTMARKNQSKQD